MGAFEVLIGALALALVVAGFWLMFESAFRLGSGDPLRFGVGRWLMAVCISMLNVSGALILMAVFMDYPPAGILSLAAVAIPAFAVWAWFCMTAFSRVISRHREQGL